MYKIYRPTGTVRGSLTVLQGKHVKKQLECKRKKKKDCDEASAFAAIPVYF